MFSRSGFLREAAWTWFEGLRPSFQQNVNRRGLQIQTSCSVPTLHASAFKKGHQASTANQIVPFQTSRALSKSASGFWFPSNQRRWNPGRVSLGREGEGLIISPVCGRHSSATAAGPVAPAPPAIVTLTREMGETDSRVRGAIHAGALLDLMDEAASAVCLQHCNHPTTAADTETVIVVLGGVEGARFPAPLPPGEEAEVTARLVFASPRSIQVLVQIHSKNHPNARNDRRLVGEAKLWYVPLNASDHSTVVPVPPLDQSADPIQFAAGLRSYNERKRQREVTALTYIDRPIMQDEICAPGTPRFSEVEQAHSLEHQFCLDGHKHARGGVGLRWMEEVASVSAMLHMRGVTGVAAVALDHAVITKKFIIGNVVEFICRVVFTSPHSLHVRVVCTALSLEFGVRRLRNYVGEATFVYVAFGNGNRILPVPPLQVHLDADKALLEERRAKYNVWKSSFRPSNA